MSDSTDKPSLKDIAEHDSAAQAQKAETSEPNETAQTADVDTPKTRKKSGGGFVWFLLIVVVAGGSIAAGWPYLGPKVDPVIADVRNLLGLGQRPTQELPSADATVLAPPEAPPVESGDPDSTPVEETPEVAADTSSDISPETTTDSATPNEESADGTAPDTLAQDASAQDTLAQADDLAQRLAVLESQIQALGAMGGRDSQAALDATVELSSALSALKTELSDLSARIAALEDASRADPTAPAQALVLGVTQLRSQLLGDGPFAAELDTLQKIAANDAMVLEQIQHLRTHADVGVPTEAALTARFAKVAKAIVTARTTSETGGWLDTVKQGLGGLVTVRRTDPAAITDQVERAVAVAEAALELGQLADAVEALSELEGAPSDAAAAWLGDARARVDAEAALEALHRHALAVLAKAGGA